LERDQRHSKPLRIGPGRFGCRYPDDRETTTHALREQFHKVPRGGPGAETEAHSRLHKIERAGGGLAFQHLGVVHDGGISGGLEEVIATAACLAPFARREQPKKALILPVQLRAIDLSPTAFATLYADLRQC